MPHKSIQDRLDTVVARPIPYIADPVKRAEMYRARAEMHGAMAVAWVEIATRRHRTIRKLSAACLVLGAFAALEGVFLWLVAR